MGELERRIKEGWFDSHAPKIRSAFGELIELTLFFGYWIWSTLYFFHTAFQGEERNALALMGSILVGWFISPVILIMQGLKILMDIHISF